MSQTLWKDHEVQSKLLDRRFDVHHRVDCPRTSKLFREVNVDSEGSGSDGLVAVVDTGRG